MAILPGLIPSLETNNTNNQETTQKMGKSFLFDFKTGDFVIRDGKLVEIEDIEALKIWIEKILRTEKFKFKIYKKEDKNQYGITIQDLIAGYNYPKEFIESEIKREVTEALLKNVLIESLEDWTIEKSNPVLNISFRVVLKDGNSFDKEVSY